MELKAGRELDALVAEKVMGWKWVEYQGRRFFAHPDHPPAVLSDPVPELYSLLHRYSTDIATAWELVDHLLKTGTQVTLRHSQVTGFHIKMVNATNERVGAISTSAPIAICLAALELVGHPVRFPCTQSETR